MENLISAVQSGKPESAESLPPTPLSAEGTQGPWTHEVLVARPGWGEVSDWIPCVVLGFTNGDVDEDFERVNVRTEGRDYGWCHPKNVRAK
jgi:hypothetical protein